MPTEVWLPVPQPAPSSGGRWLLWFALLLALMACLLLSIAGLGFFFYNSDLILPGVRVLGLSVGGLNRGEAVAALQARWQEQAVSIEDGSASWVVGPAELGMTIDALATAEAAYRLGRSPETLLGALLNGRGLELSPVWRFDPGVAQATLENLAPQLALQPISAGIGIVNGQVEVTPPADGRELDVNATLAALQQNPGVVLQNGRLPLVVQTLPPAITDVSAAADKASQLLTTAITVQAYDPVRDETVTWAVAPEMWSQWLSLTVDPANSEELSWQMDQVAAGHYFTSQEATLGDGRFLDEEAVVTALREAITLRQSDVEARIYHAPRQHTVQFGETLSSIGNAYGIPYPWIEQANPGIGQLSEGQTITIPSVDELLPLPVVKNKRIIVSIAEQRMRAYESGVLVWDWPVSTGIDSSPTAPGIFQIQSHVENAYAGNWDLWMPHFLGIYRPVPTSEFMNGFHGFPTRGSSQLLWTGDLGHKVTYGCILVSSENAVQLYNWAEEGVVVEVVES
jgi:lipoprotein-anchoring transpeptidase ErfK/SrfK